jgi:LysM repeat protein
MTNLSQHDTQTTEGTVLSGLVPTPGAFVREPSPRDTGKISRTMLATMPIILVGSMAVSMNLTGPIERVEAKSPAGDKAEKSLPPTTEVDDEGVTANAEQAQPDAEISTAAAPSTYKVASGDTVSSIAGRYGLSTASVLALNGLGWKSTIFPGQVLKLSSGTVAAAPAPVAAAPVASGKYTIVKGDTVSRIASRFGVSVQSVLTANGLSLSSIIYPGQSLAIPGASAPAAAQPVAKPVVSAPVVSAPVVTAPVASPPAAASGTYRIVAGDNLTKIASKLGVSLQSLLTANGLTSSSIIYAGRTLVNPAVATAAPASKPGTVTLLTQEQAGNARVVISVGRSLGVSDYGIVIALAAAMQESSLRNINYGHLDSLGLFQQRPTSGWGTPAQLTDPTHAAKLFYGGPSNPNKGITRGLLDIPGWSALTVTQAAQKVQISAYPDAYAKWETSARFWLSDLR